MDELLTTAQAAVELGVCNWTIRSWVSEGKLPARRLPGGQFRIRRSDLEAILIPA